MKIVVDAMGGDFAPQSIIEGAVEAIKELDGKEVNGRNIKVNEARPKENRPRRRNQY